MTDVRQSDLRVLELVSSVIDSIAQTYAGEAKQEIDGLIAVVEGGKDIVPQDRIRWLDALSLASRELRAAREQRAAIILSQLSAELWKRVLPREEPIAKPVASRLPSVAGPSSKLPQRFVAALAMTNEPARDPDLPISTTAPKTVIPRVDNRGPFRVALKGAAWRTVREAAKILRVPQENILDLISKGDLSAEQFETNGQLFIAKKSLAAYKAKMIASSVAAGRKRTRIV